MNATVFFIYLTEPARSFTCENTIHQIEGTIRYWMGKSPGMYEVDQIIVIPEDQKRDWMYVLQEIQDEETEYHEKMLILKEKEDYERLKAKYGQQDEHPKKSEHLNL